MSRCSCGVLLREDQMSEGPPSHSKFATHDPAESFHNIHPRPILGVYITLNFRNPQENYQKDNTGGQQ
jgi:uncharacterized protein YpiB (UPF0302 family)